MGNTLNPEHLGYNLLQNEIQRGWIKKKIKQDPETRSKKYEPQLCMQDGQQNF